MIEPDYETVAEMVAGIMVDREKQLRLANVMAGKKPDAPIGANDPGHESREWLAGRVLFLRQFAEQTAQRRDSRSAFAEHLRQIADEIEG